MTTTESAAMTQHDRVLTLRETAHAAGVSHDLLTSAAFRGLGDEPDLFGNDSTLREVEALTPLQQWLTWSFVAAYHGL